MKSLFWLATFLPSLAFGAFSSSDFSSFAQMPVQHEGRFKPLDTFARTHLLAFNAKESSGDLTASAWLAETLFDPERAYQREIFYLPNPDVTTVLGLERREKHRYSFNEVFPALRTQADFLAALREKESEFRTPAQNQLLELDAKAARFFEISRSLSFLLPIFQLTDESLALKLGLKNGEKYSYSQLLRQRELLRLEAAASGETAGQARDFLTRFEAIEGWAVPDVLRVFPPQFQAGDVWLSPWRVIQNGEGSPKVAESLQQWRQMAVAYRDAAGKDFSAAAAAAQVESRKLVRSGVIPIEYAYNRGKLFQKAVAFYVTAFLFLLTGWLFWGVRMRQAAFWLLCCGGVFHLVGVLMRMFVMARPPVSTLYESVLFVALVAVLAAVGIERIKRNGAGTLIGAVAGSVLLFISFGYAAEGDTMGVLVAVLNTNFWLATHVVCITIGYGTCIVGGILGHLYLLAAASGRGREKLDDLFRSTVGVAGVALLFASIGTILGGIWADQSWGRFWGWDPKENGAMWICLWLLFLLHGRLAGILKGPGFALGMVFNNVVVALAWFGVNLLNVGLHSYGFTENIALNLFLFCLGETIFGLVTFHYARIYFVVKSLERNSAYVPEVLSSTD